MYFEGTDVIVLEESCVAYQPVATGGPVKNSAQQLFSLSLLGVGLAAVSGCGVGGRGSTPGPVGVAAARVGGTVHGGQQPVAGASIGLFVAGKTGNGSATRSLLTGPVMSDANGNFTINAVSACQAGDQAYLTATGGDSGSGTNTAIALMSALGSCATLEANFSTLMVNVDEVTTAVSVGALAPYMLGVQQVGSAGDAASINALAAAFASVATQVDTTSGLAKSGSGIATATINSLANSLAACINSTQGSAACTSLFANTTANGVTPTDTVGAALNLAVYPNVKTTATVFGLGTSNPPFQPMLASAPTLFTIYPSDVLTYHNDNRRQGVQAYETVLTPANVKSATFGKKFTVPVDSYLYAHPLYAGMIGMPDAKVHNLLIAASTHATVYVVDAENGTVLWTQSYVPSGERFSAKGDYGGCPNPEEAGIVGTPVIDRGTQTLYFVTKTTNNSSNSITQRMHAVSLLDGTERANSPQVIAPVFAGSGAGAVSGSIPFDAQFQVNRAAMTMTVSPSGLKTVWATFASSCDIGPYHGVMLGYNAGDVSSMNARFNDTPNGSDGGIWMGAGGLAEDAAGNLYASVGNGTFDPATGSYGDSAMKLAGATAAGAGTMLSVADYFTPSNQANLQAQDRDLGGNDNLLIADPASAVAPQLLIASDKYGYIYLLNTATMGRYQTGTNGIDGKNGDVQDFKAGGIFIYSFAFFNNMLYTSEPLAGYAFTPGTASTAGHLSTTATYTASASPAAPVVSANGAADGVVWAADQSANLHAYNTSLTELYNTTQAAGGRDTAPTAVRFISPMVANGKVYLAGKGSLVAYGLLP